MFLEERFFRIFALCPLLSSRWLLLTTRYTWFTKLLAAYLSLKLRCLGLILLVECYSSPFLRVFFQRSWFSSEVGYCMLIARALLALLSLLLIAPFQWFAARNIQFASCCFILAFRYSVFISHTLPLANQCFPYALLVIPWMLLTGHTLLPAFF